MPEKSITTLEPEKKRRLLSILESLLPLVDSLADKLRFLWILGLLVTGWLVVWCYNLKHYSLGLTAFVGIAAFLPTLILVSFWWALEELKSLPEIAGQLVGDAKSQLQGSVQYIRAGKAPKLGFFSAAKRLWSIGWMASEALELVGSSINVATLVNPVMLILGVISILVVFLLFFVGVMLAFFV
jgi:hypothetical protein